mgnify:CR=1 FL=1
MNVDVDVGWGVNVGVLTDVEVGVAVATGVPGMTNSKAPISHPTPCGRAMPR